MSQTALVPIVMFGWIPVVLLIFLLLPSWRAVIVAFLFAWLFLPMASFHIQGIPAYTKMSATVGGVLLAASIFDLDRLSSSTFCPSIFDLPMLVLCFSPFATAMANDPELTIHDGISFTFEHIVIYGLPYLIGRIYFSDLKAMKELAVGVFIGGLVYVPLCIFEMKMSPELHRMVYGFDQAVVAQQIRIGGWRPMVFMQHGLAVGLFMTCASLSGIWLWSTLRLRRRRDQWIFSILLLIQIATTILCRSTGALFLMVVGLLILFLTKWSRSYALLVIATLIPPAYIFSRTVMDWNGEGATQIATFFAGDVRSDSLDYRFENEKFITARAEQRPWFGWGGYARAYPLDENGMCKWTPDSLWIITFGEYGTVGIAALCALLIPIPVLLMRLGPSAWAHPQFVGVTIFSILLLIFSMDNLVNNMPNPVLILGLGGLTGVLVVSVRGAQERSMDQAGSFLGHSQGLA